MSSGGNSGSNTQKSAEITQKVENTIELSTGEENSANESAAEEGAEVASNATTQLSFTYSSSGDYWFYTDGMFPQSEVADSSTISSLNSGATLTGSTYAIGNETFSVFELDGSEYVHVSSTFKNVATASDDGTWFLVEPIVWIVAYGSDEPSIGSVAVSKDVVTCGAYSSASSNSTFTSLFNSTKENSSAAVASGSLVYSAIDTVTYDVFNGSRVVSVNLGDAATSSNVVVTSAGYRVASVYEIDNLGGSFTSSCSDLVAYLLTGSTSTETVAYWVRDLAYSFDSTSTYGEGSYSGTYNNGLYVTTDSTIMNIRLANTMGARLSVVTTQVEVDDEEEPSTPSTPSTTNLTIYKDSAAIKGYSINMGYFPQTYITSVSGLTDVTSSLAYAENCYVVSDGNYYLCEEIVWDVIAYYDDDTVVYDFDGIDLTQLPSGTQVIVLSRYCLAAMAFNESGEWAWGEGVTMYDWLNGDFYDNAFTDEEKSAILTYDDTETSAPYTNIDVSTDPYVWLLSYTEASTWLTASERISYNTAYCVSTGDDEGDETSTAAGTCYWWLRSCGNDSYGGYSVRTDGIIYNYYTVNGVYEAARPALLINL